MAAETCKSCGKKQQEGERFVFNGYVWRCGSCAQGRMMSNPIFPYTTTNLTGHPILINSLYHLRKLEAQHGAASAAFNMDSRNFNDPVGR